MSIYNYVVDKNEYLFIQTYYVTFCLFAFVLPEWLKECVLYQLTRKDKKRYSLYESASLFRVAFIKANKENFIQIQVFKVLYHAHFEIARIVIINPFNSLIKSTQ